MTRPASRGRWGRAAAILVLLGTTVGTLLDGIHSHFGATVYTHPVVWRMAWWVPVLFGGAFTVGLVRPILDRIPGWMRPAPSWGRTALAFGIFVAAYFASVLPMDWRLVAATLAALFAVGWTLADRTPGGLVTALIGAVGGPLVEILLSWAGTFSYIHPVFAGVGGWLPCLYLTAGLGIGSLGKRLVDG